MKKLCLLLIIGIWLVSGNVSAFDDEKTHPYLTGAAVEAIRETIQPYLKDMLKLRSGLEQSIKDKSLKEWLKVGSTDEDDPPCRASNHFHNPLDISWSIAGMKDEPWFIDLKCSLGEYPPSEINSAVHWATGYTQPAEPNVPKMETGNQWDWDHAREYFYAYLTGKNFQEDVVASTQDEREANLADSFKALGHVLHLLQDMAVPAHVRDDFKSHLDWAGITWETKFEPLRWFADKFEYLVAHHRLWITAGTGAYLTEPTLTNFWDTDNYIGQDPDSLPLNLIGLAEYTNMNFVSGNTMFTEHYPTDDVYYHPYPREASTDLQAYINGNKPPESVVDSNNVYIKKFYVAKTGDGEHVTHFLTATYMTRYVLTTAGSYSAEFNLSLDIDEQCARDHASFLLPRAVGCSAALLDYFFRGTLEITAPDRYVYSIIDGSEIPHEFTSINAKVRNITTHDEPMQDGIIQAVARYKKRTDYQPNLSTDPPTEASREEAFSYSVSAPIEIESLSSTEPTEFLFDFTSSPIPAGVTDLYLYVIFKGTLGNEGDTAIAVGMKDLNEPMHICLWNATDRFYLDGVLRTGQEIRNDPDLLGRVDFDGDEIVNEVEIGEPYIDPYDLTTEVTFYQTSAPEEYHASYNPLAPASHGRIIILTDTPTFYMHIYRESTDPLEDSTSDVLFSGVVYQEDSDGVFHPGPDDPPVVRTFRDIVQ
ncbi:MAG: hypothetical protein GKC08_07320, partial [Methanosarcinales archaeon]|nr:hypothetical protein [Methanosarcinales archaeon]